MKNYWKTYKELELISGSRLEPIVSKSIIVKRLSLIWRSMSNRSAQRLSYQQQFEHLEQCFEINETAQIVKQSRFWHNIWAILNQPLFEWNPTASREPEIRQVLDRTGQTWWYAHDPLTGQSTYLESEEDVQIWLEERMHYYNY